MSDWVRLITGDEAYQEAMRVTDAAHAEALNAATTAADLELRRAEAIKAATVARAESLRAATLSRADTLKRITDEHDERLRHATERERCELCGCDCTHSLLDRSTQSQVEQLLRNTRRSGSCEVSAAGRGSRRICESLRNSQ